jgi:prepilin-type N-terminal cleavage/methylation domain-containing protein
MRDDGFTIVEALTAMAILAVGLVTLYGVGADALNAGAHVARTDRALIFAETKLEELSLTGTPLPAHAEGTSVEDGLNWSLTAHDISNDRGVSERRVLQEITLDVRWRDGLKTRSISLETRHLGAVSP